MRTIEVEAIWSSSEDANLDQLKELGIKVNDSERKEEKDLITINIKYIAAFNPTLDPHRTRVWMGGGLGDFLINMPYNQFKELYHSTEAKEEIV